MKIFLTEIYKTVIVDLKYDNKNKLDYIVNLLILFGCIIGTYFLLKLI